MDELLCKNLGIEASAMRHYVATASPTYLDLEEWVRRHATNFTPEAVHKHTLEIRSRDMSNQILAAQRRATFGITDAAFAHAVTLNDLDDWAMVHQSLVEMPSS